MTHGYYRSYDVERVLANVGPKPKFRRWHCGDRTCGAPDCADCHPEYAHRRYPGEYPAVAEEDES